MPRILLIGIVALSFLNGGCGREDRTATESMTPESAPPASATTPLEETNTSLNVRDREGALPTPIDQSNRPEDLEITQRIRQAILDDQALSVSAENIKIITIDGKVTLRGPVKSEAEKAAIVAKAQQVAGTTQVDDQLEVMVGSSG